MEDSPRPSKRAHQEGTPCPGVWIRLGVCCNRGLLEIFSLVQLPWPTRFFHTYPYQAARQYGCEVDTLTLSFNQKKLAEERIREAGLQHLVRVHLMDYREIPPEFEKKFDAFVSVEMIEVKFSTKSQRNDL
jgi:hypothetical protein